MRTLLPFIAALCIAGQSFADSPDTIAELLVEIDVAVSEMRGDHNRNEPSAFGKIDTSKLTKDELTQAAILSKCLADTKAVSQQPYPGLTEAERTTANQQLDKLSFTSSTKLSDKTKKELAAFFRSHPSLDPRIVSVSYVDKKPMQIVSSIPAGWCATGLNFYVGRHENGRGIVRRGFLADNGR